MLLEEKLIILYEKTKTKKAFFVFIILKMFSFKLFSESS